MAVWRLTKVVPSALVKSTKRSLMDFRLTDVELEDLLAQLRCLALWRLLAHEGGLLVHLDGGVRGLEEVRLVGLRAATALLGADIEHGQCFAPGRYSKI